MYTFYLHTDLIEALSDDPTESAVVTTVNNMQPGPIMSGATTNATITSSSGTHPTSNVPVTDVVTVMTYTEPTASNEGSYSYLYGLWNK